MILLMAINDAHDYPFWIAQVNKFNKENEELISIEVHWYATYTHPFDGVQKEDMMVEQRLFKRRKKEG